MDSEQTDELPNWLFDDEDPDSYFMPVNTLTYTDAQTVKRVYALAKKICDVFTRHSLFFWTTGGTTLGIVRHGGLIPWDDDLDICILKKVKKILVAVKVVVLNIMSLFNTYLDKIFMETDM